MNDSYNYTNTGKEFNKESNSSLLASIIAKLANLDMILGSLRQEMDTEIKDLTNCHNQKNDMDNHLNMRLGEIQNELYAKINRMIDGLKEHQMYQRAEGLKLQQEISILKKEKLELYQRVTDLQRRISDMENNIGFEVK